MIATLYFILLLLLAVLQFGFVSSLPAPYGYVPLLFVAMVLIYQRVGWVMGFVWCCGSILISFALGFSDVSWWSLLITGLLAIPLTDRLFTNRSIYALIGFSLVLYLVLITVHSLGIATARVFSSDVVASTIASGTIPMRLLVLAVATVAGYLLTRYVARTAKTFFYIRDPHVS